MPGMDSCMTWMVLDESPARGPNEARNRTTRMRETFRKAGADRIESKYHHDGDRTRGPQSDFRLQVSRDHDDVRIEPQQFRRQSRQFGGPTVSDAPVEY